MSNNTSPLLPPGQPLFGKLTSPPKKGGKMKPENAYNPGFTMFPDHNSNVVAIQ